MDTTSYCFCSPSVSLQMSVMNRERGGPHMRSYTNQRALPRHIGTLICSWTQVNTQSFLLEAVSFSFGLSRTSVEVVWMQKGLNEMKNQCHEPSFILLIHPASSDIHHMGRDLLDNHSAISISLKNVKQTRDLRCILGRGERWLGSIGKTARPSSPGCWANCGYL